MTQPIDVAYVDIVARDKSLRSFRKDVDDTFKKLDKDIITNLDTINNNLETSFSDIDDHFKKVAASAEESFESIGDTIKSTLSDVDVDIDRHGRRVRSRFAVIGAAVGDVFEAAGKKITSVFSTVFKSISDNGKEVLSGLGLIGSTLGGFVTSSPLVALIAVLVPAIIALAGALAQLVGIVGVLPSGLAVLVAAILPVVIAFQNFGDAVSALASGDIEKIDEALKKLSPSARQVAREVANLIPQLKSLQRGIQESFFFQVRGSFAQVIQAFTSNSFVTAVGTVATAMGKLTAQFAGFLSSQDTVQTFTEVFQTTARIIGQIGPPIIALFDAITTTVHESLPFVERLAIAFGNALTAFAAFINQSVESGAFDKFIEDAFTTIKELIDLVKASGGLLGTLFAGTEEAGHDFIKTLTDAIIKLDDFFKSTEGKDALKDLSTIVDLTGKAIGAVITSVLLLDKSFRISLKTFEVIGRAFVDLIGAIGDFFGKIPAKFEEFKSFLGRIPEAIVTTIKDSFNLALTTLGVQIGLILLVIQELPNKIGTFISTIPQRIKDALSATGPTVLEVFATAFNDATLFVQTKFAEIIEFVRSVPDKIIALGPVFLQAGKNLIQSFMNGFRAVGSFIGDIAGDIVSSVKSFLNKAIDKINSGIAAVDAILPGNLGRIPRLAQGAVVGRRPGGTLAVVGEGREDEVVAPLSTLEDIIRKAFGGGGPGGGMNVSFGPGSINIGFGAVPTEGEARSAGAAVADGIVEQLAKRNVRTQVRSA